MASIKKYKTAKGTAWRMCGRFAGSATGNYWKNFKQLEKHPGQAF